MSKTLQNCIKNVSQGKQPEKYLPEYVRQSIKIHDSHARLNLMMHYYLFYEISQERDAILETARENVDDLNRAIGEIFSGREISLARWQELSEEILAIRQEVTGKMEVLTAYIGRFCVYEHVISHIRYRFKKKDKVIEQISDQEFAQQIVQFIFSTRDNVIINDNIHFVLEELPMRMTRKRYLDLVKDSVMLYQGADVGSLEAHLELFRTNAMLYRSPYMEKYFTQYRSVLLELDDMDYENIDQESYEHCHSLIVENDIQLKGLMDFYLQLQMVINQVYALLLTGSYIEKKKDTIPDTVIEGINALFTGCDSDVWSRGNASGDIPGTREERVDWLTSHLVKVEGKQEEVYDVMTMVDAVLEEIRLGQDGEIERLNLTREFETLEKLTLLSSNSSFVSLQVQQIQEEVSPARAKQEAAKLVEELKQAFEGQSRRIRRGVMACTMSTIPVFFESSQEVMDYVRQSLELCSDKEEKYASKLIIADIINPYNDFD